MVVNVVKIRIRVLELVVGFGEQDVQCAVQHWSEFLKNVRIFLIPSHLRDMNMAVEFFKNSNGYWANESLKSNHIVLPITLCAV